MVFLKNFDFNTLIVGCFFLFCCSTSFSQEEKNHNYYWKESDNPNAIIGVNNCYVRNTPSKTGVLLDSLQIGQEVLILKSTENLLKIKGINVSWIEIQYKDSKNETKTGFLWKGFLALGFKKKQAKYFFDNNR